MALAFIVIISENYGHISCRVPSTGIESVNWTPVNGNSNGSAIPFLKISSPSNIYMDCGKNMGRPDFWHSLNLNENEHYTPT